MVLPKCPIGGPSSILTKSRMALKTVDATHTATGTDLIARINVFDLTATGGCHLIRESGANSGSFAPLPIAGAAGWDQIALAHNGDGRLELFALANGMIYHLWQTDA